MGEDKTTDMEYSKPGLDSVLKLLLKTLSLDDYEDAFVEHGILTIEDLQNHEPESLISMGILNRGQYEDMMGICSTIAPLTMNGTPFNPEQYQKSILSSHYGQRLRMSIVQSRKTRMGEEYFQESSDSDYPLDDENGLLGSNDSLNQFSATRYSFLSNASEESLPLLEFDEMERQMGITSVTPASTTISSSFHERTYPTPVKTRHTVDVSRVQRNHHLPAPYFPPINSLSSSSSTAIGTVATTTTATATATATASPSSFLSASISGTQASRQPRSTISVTSSLSSVEERPTMDDSSHPLGVIQENVYCDGLKEMSGGVYDDTSGKSSLCILLASLAQPSSVEITSTSVFVPALAKDPRSRTPTSYSFPSIYVHDSLDQLASDLLTQLVPSIPNLFAGQNFTVLLYGSLASPASSLFLPAPSPDVSLPSQFGFQLLSECNQRNWTMGMSCFMLNENITTDLLSNNDRRAVMDSGSIIFMKGMKCYATLSNDDILAVLNTARETTPSPPPAAASTVVVYQLVTPQGQYGARVGFVLLPPCDRTIPVVQGGSNSFQINNSSIAALSNVARVFENRIRQPFRDNKLTLYLRPFLFSTTTVLIGCLPPYDDSLPSIPAVYSVKPAPGPKRLSRFVEAKPKTSNLQPTKNTENFATILRYCARFRGQKGSKPSAFARSCTRPTHTNTAGTASTVGAPGTPGTPGTSGLTRTASTTSISSNPSNSSTSRSGLSSPLRMRMNPRADPSALNRDAAELLRQYQMNTEVIC